MTETPALHLERPAFLDDKALQAVLKALPNARLVGGAVRDAIANRPVADIDLATPDPPDAVVQALEAAGLKHAPTGLQHGTVTAISRGRGFEVTTLRTDERTDGRHAEVAWTTNWQQDAARRDFTINAMSMQQDGAVFDYFGGLADLQAGRVRFVGEPERRIAEDYLRVLRFFRFQARYGTESPAPDTLDALRRSVPGLERLSVERVWSEFKRILIIPNPIRAVRLMVELDVLQAVLRTPIDPANLERLVQSGAPPDPLLRLFALTPAAPNLADRLKLSNREAQTLAGLAGPLPDPAWDDAALRRALANTPAEHWIGRAWLTGGADPPWAALRTRLQQTPAPKFPLHGRDALQLGVPPGPAVGALLEAVRTWWMAGGCIAGPAECRAELARLIAR